MGQSQIQTHENNQKIRATDAALQGCMCAKDRLLLFPQRVKPDPVSELRGETYIYVHFTSFR